MTCNIYYIATALSLTPKLGRNIIRSLARSLPSALAAGRDSLTLSKQLMNRKASVFILKSKESSGAKPTMGLEAVRNSNL